MFLFPLLLLPVAFASEEEEGPVDVTSTKFWCQILAIVCLVLLSGIIAGLTLGLMSLDTTNLKILQLAGTKKQQYYASRILPIRKNGHILLTTLLLTNTVLNETLPILFDDIFRKGFMSVIVSTVLLVLFSEIIPQAVFSKHGLAIGSLFAFPVRILIGLWFVVSWPISKFLDWMLGPHEGFSYTESELSALIQLHDNESDHGCLDNNLVKILQNVLTMQETKIADILNTNHFAFVPSDTILTGDDVEEYIRQKYTHVIVYQPKNEENIIGVLTLERLSKEHTQPVGKMPLESFVKLNSSTPVIQAISQMVERNLVILIYRTEEEIELSKKKPPLPGFHERALSCRIKRFFGYLCHACSEETDEEEKEVNRSISTAIDVGLIGLLINQDLLNLMVVNTSK
ncbi:hypothetical protein BY458DRAFT_586579 [Sporodiniella umbellata]|nr:hypothetical protein BY458DRAFT_586579 [Sporodiniella umbellata]